MRKFISLLSLAILATSLGGCAVVATTAVVGAAAVGVATTAVGVTYDVSKTVVKGAVSAGAYAYEAAATEPTPQPSPNRTNPLPTPHYESARSYPLSE
jgi:hypothetical protein